MLATKSELQKAMEKRSQHRKLQEKQTEESQNKTPFQIKLEERARRLEQVTTFFSSLGDIQCHNTGSRVALEWHFII